MKKFSVVLIALIAVLAFSPLAMANTVPLTAGSTLVTNGSDASWIIGTSVTFNLPTGDSSVASGTNGSFITGGVAKNDDIKINNVTINFASPSEMVFTIYSSKDGSDTGTALGTFTIAGPITMISDTNYLLAFSGSGIMTLNGYLPTAVTFTFSDNDNSGHAGQLGESSQGFTINSTGLFVPEPGSLVLFGSGLLGLAGMLRSRFSKKSN